ncbi:hypothetical protein Tco_0174089 [Tanacetum coccineum]
MSIEIRKKEKELLQQEKASYVSTSQQFNFIYDDDDDEESSIPLSDIIFELPPCITITPILSTVEPVDSLIMEDEHLDITPATESDELIKSSVENLVPIASVSEDFSDIEIYRFHNEDLDSTPKNDRFDTESYLLESLLNRDTLMASSPKIDSLFNEFSGELITIPLRISLPTFPIPVEDSDSLMEEIDIFPRPGDSIPPDIESDDYDSKGDDNSTSLPEFESFHDDYPNSGRITTIYGGGRLSPLMSANILPTHPTLHMDFDFIPSHNDLVRS